MKLLHTSDLHLGKRLHEQSLIEEQRDMLEDLLRITREEAVSAVLIAGDVYDRSVPPLDAVNLFDDFLTQLAALGVPVLLIAGNHDSADRLDFGARILQGQNVHIAGKELKTVTLEDNFGSVQFWLLPYLRAQAAADMLEAASVDTNQRNVMLAHQFIISASGAPELGGSEWQAVGGVDAMDASFFADFDYVALGHIHRPQKIGRETMRYSGSPYPYSFAECGVEKSAVLVDLGAKGDVTLSFAPLIPERGLFRLSSTIADLPAQTAPRDAYIELTLTDDEPVVDAIEKVRAIYPNTLRLILDSRYARGIAAEHRLEAGDLKAKTPYALFEGFFEEMNGVSMTETQQAILRAAIESEVGV